MRRFHLLFALLITLGLTLLAGCPPTNDDDDSDGNDDAELCSGTYCVNATPANTCPGREPDAGDSCTFNGNCHYCLPGSMQANGYTCDGTSFTFVNTFACEG